MRDWIRVAALPLCVSLAFLPAGLEVVLRRTLSSEELLPLSADISGARIQPHPYLSYSLRPLFSIDDREEGGQQVFHNSMGFRGREIAWAKPPDVFRIVCLGGSSTYGFGPSSDATTWPARLEFHLNQDRPEGSKRIEVVNGGCQGYSTFESLINLELRMVDLQPDLVIVYHAINDMRCALYRTPMRDNVHWRTVWPVGDKCRIERALESSYLFLVARYHLTDWADRRSRLGAYVIADFEPHEDHFAKGAPAEVGFRSFYRNLSSIAAVAERHGAQVLFSTQGMRYTDLDHLPSSVSQRAALELMNDLVLKAADELDIAAVDAAQLMEDVATHQEYELGRDRIFTREVHLTDEGADMLSRILAHEIRERAMTD